MALVDKESQRELSVDKARWGKSRALLRRQTQIPAEELVISGIYSRICVNYQQCEMPGTVV